MQWSSCTSLSAIDVEDRFVTGRYHTVRSREDWRPLMYLARRREERPSHMKCFSPAVPLLLIPMLYGCTSPAATADWQWGAVMPEARSARATCAVENRIFTIGDTS